ncbi:DUF6848 family protein [Anaerovorax sp. IOR16]|uniref:DUF6848 family protein n=1 Tax=Anaerovorax sp. IOR16 TaxID=2773458 RepID=UPI0019D2D883|nr:hypothetical protein [Anaerovorax sp. IOR16]
MENKEKDLLKKDLNVEELKKKYGKVYEVKAEIEPEGEFETVELIYYFVKPKAPSFNRYIKTVSQNSMKATKTFVIDNIVEEQLADIEDKFEKYPALCIGIGEKLLNMLGLPKSTNFKLL